MATKAKAVKTVDVVDGVDGVDTLNARAAVEEWERVAWEMRPHQQAFVRALFALLWLLAELLREIRTEVRK